MRQKQSRCDGKGYETIRGAKIYFIMEMGLGEWISEAALLADMLNCRRVRAGILNQKSGRGLVQII